MKDHEIQETVNKLRDISLKFGHTQQLREHIHKLIVPILKKEVHTEKLDKANKTIKQIKSSLKMRRGLSKKLPVADQKVGMLCCYIQGIERIIRKYEKDK